MKAAYLETIGLIERLHRHFLEIVKLEAPLLFQDFHREADGSWTPEWRKV